MSAQNGDGNWRCPTCGATFEAGIKTCPYCNPQKEQVAQSQAQAPAGTTGQEPPVQATAVPAPPMPAKKKKNWVVPVVVILVVFFAFIALAYEGYFAVDGITKDYQYGEGDHTFEWTYDGGSYSLSFDIPVQDLASYTMSTEQRQFTSIGSEVDYDHAQLFVTPDDAVIMKIMAGLKQLAYKAGLDTYGTLSLILAFVQSIPYEYDLDQFGIDDYWQYPVETLYHYAGDCEDTAFLYVSLVEAYGTDTVLLVYSNHVAAGVDSDDAYGTYYTHDGVRYYYCETTGEGWDIGEMPEDRQKDNQAHIVNST